MASSSTPKGVDMRLVVGLGLAIAGIVLSIALFQSQRQAGPTFVGADEPSPAWGFLAGSIAAAGLVLLAYWSRQRWARQVAREARPEIEAAVRDAHAPQRALRCASCQHGNDAQARFCDQCGATLAA